MIASTAFSLAPPWLIRQGIDEHILVGRAERLLWLALLMALLALLRGIFDLGKRHQAELVAQKIVHDIRRDLFNHISRLSFFFFNSSLTGDLLSRLTSDTDDVRRLLSFVSINLIGNFLLLLGILLILLFWELRLDLLYLLFFPVMIQAMRIYAGRVRPVFARSRRQLAGLTEKVRENLLGRQISATEVEKMFLEITGPEMAESLPEGIDTAVGEEGGQLSGGQKKIIELLRLLVRDPDIVVLDEPTSSLDLDTEARVRSKMKDYLASLAISRNSRRRRMMEDSPAEAITAYILDCFKKGNVK